ncbi:DsrE family protein [Hydrogenovibrio sp. JE_KL2]|uniref:DsrE family protein n=1 Tax=Hydrogenovibrio sp. JE_KL2 TaxID=2651188 RepID=UPI00128CD5AB|nr:DsrE family protein [Hydrogenovibrio sp. JE_KL2]MPQ77141.1 DsrE family protein [Hydrogenovibrio sp. JE_KL2]
MFRIFYQWFVACLFTFAFITSASAADSTILKVQHKHDIKVVYDVNQNNIEAGIGQALYYVRGLLEAYKGQGIPMEQLHISVVVHGAAGYWLLKDPKYQDFVGNPFDVNPNEKVVKELIAHGVSVEICHVTMKAHRWKPEDILPGVKIVYDAYTRIIDLQMQGYAYVKFSE